MKSPQHFNETAASKESMADEIIKSLKIRPGMSIADLGSGGGYFAFLFSKEVGPDGKVIALDTNSEFLAHIKKNAQSNNIKNIKTLQRD